MYVFSFFLAVSSVGTKQLYLTTYNTKKLFKTVLHRLRLWLLLFGKLWLNPCGHEVNMGRRWIVCFNSNLKCFISCACFTNYNTQSNSEVSLRSWSTYIEPFISPLSSTNNSVLNNSEQKTTYFLTSICSRKESWNEVQCPSCIVQVSRLWAFLYLSHSLFKHTYQRSSKNIKVQQHTAEPAIR